MHEAYLVATRTSFTFTTADFANANLLHFDPASDAHAMVFANDRALSSTLMQIHEGILHLVRFCGRVWEEDEVKYHPGEREVLALLQLL